MHHKAPHVDRGPVICITDNPLQSASCHTSRAFRPVRTDNLPLARAGFASEGLAGGGLCRPAQRVAKASHHHLRERELVRRDDAAGAHQIRVRVRGP